MLIKINNGCPMANKEPYKLLLDKNTVNVPCKPDEHDYRPVNGTYISGTGFLIENTTLYQM